MFVKKRFGMTNESIDKISEEISSFAKAEKIDSADATRIRLGLEEVLLRYKERFGENTPVDLLMTKSFGKIKISVSIESEMYDPFAKSGEKEDQSSFMRSVLSNMGQLPVWRYFRGENTVEYIISKKHMQSWKQLLICIVLAVVCGIVLKLVPENITAVFHDDILSPVLSTFMNLLSGIAGPMIFLAIVWGIYSIGDISAFSVMGKRMTGRLLTYIGAITVVIGLITLPVFTLVSGDAQIGTAFSSVFEMILNIVPGNIILPFTEGNTLQILFIGIIMGIAMIAIGEKTKTVAIFAEQLNHIVQLIMDFISRLVPFFVFGSILDIILNNQFSDIAISYKFFFVNAGACVALVVFYVILVSVVLHVRPLTYFKKGLRTIIVCVTTASSSAAFSSSLDACINGYGVDESLADFGVPFSQIIFKPTVAILYFSSAVYVAETSGTPVSLTWLVIAFALSFILSVATPPIPGGALASMTVLFAQLGLPMSDMAVVLALNVILDFIETPTDVYGGHAMLVLAANKFKMINKDILRK